jgi:DNA anti-recombination protein RmuC
MSDELDRVAMVSDLKALERRISDELDKRIDHVSDELGKRIDHVSDELGKRIDHVSDELNKRIVQEGETIRRHFDIMVERVESAVKLVAEVNTHHASVLDDHESRLQRIEKRGI